HIGVHLAGVPVALQQPRALDLEQVDIEAARDVQVYRARPDALGHRHSGQVHAYVLRGKWLYLEHDWVATEGSYVFEPPGETHTLVVPDDCQDMVTLFTVHGALMYVDPQGRSTGYDDVFTRIDKYRAHFEAVGLGADHVRRFMR
ncbi:MAG: 2,4'-dihydroxyacetophenone dioxygenase family protein, partial [Limnohabitans sp.]